MNTCAEMNVTRSSLTKTVKRMVVPKVLMIKGKCGNSLSFCMKTPCIDICFIRFIFYLLVRSEYFSKKELDKIMLGLKYCFSINQKFEGPLEPCYWSIIHPSLDCWNIGDILDDPLQIWTVFD